MGLVNIFLIKYFIVKKKILLLCPFVKGEMAERSNAAVLKTVVRATGPGVRIPFSPQFIVNKKKSLENCMFLRLFGFL